ncbi:autotransporter outer membrane beta-barrel domain-containing protein, partial [Lonepinella koalarum]
MKIVHFKYSALTLALMANFAIANSAQITQTTDEAPIYVQDLPYYKLTNKNITDSSKYASLRISNVTTSVLNNVSIMHSSKQVGIASISETNITIDGLNITSTSDNSYFGVYLNSSNASINNMTLDATITRSPKNSPFFGALQFLENGEQASQVINSSITNHGNSSSVVALARSNAIFDNVKLNATGKDSAIFSIKDRADVIARNLTAKNTGENGVFIQVEQGDLGEARHYNFTLENSNIVTDKGINWVKSGKSTFNLSGAVQAVGIYLNNTTFKVEDELVHAIYDENSFDIFTTVLELDNNSTLIGGFEFPNSYIDISLRPRSKWKMTANSHVDNLSSLGGSLIDFAYDDNKTKTLKVEGQYSGSHSFNLNSKLIDNQSDKIVLNGKIKENSSAILNITDRSGNDEFVAPSHSAIVLEAIPDYASNITVTLNGTIYVNAGGYRYRLMNETTDGHAIWKLTNLLEDGNLVKDPDFNKPKAEEPKADEPKPDEPKTDEPKADEPKVDEPKVDEPKVDEPKTDEPKADEPKADEPKVDEPKADEP